MHEKRSLDPFIHTITNSKNDELLIWVNCRNAAPLPLRLTHAASANVKLLLPHPHAVVVPARREDSPGDVPLHSPHVAPVLAQAVRHGALGGRDLVDADAPVLRLTRRGDANGTARRNRLVVLPDVVAPRDAPHRALAVLENAALLPHVAVGELPDLGVLVRSDRQTHGVVARLAPRQAVHGLVHLQGRIARPCPYLERIHRFEYINRLVLAADRLGIKLPSVRHQVQPKAAGAERYIERREAVRGDAAALYPRLLLVIANCLLVDGDRVVVQAGREDLAKNGVRPVHTTNQGGMCFDF